MKKNWLISIIAGLFILLSGIVNDVLCQPPPPPPPCAVPPCNIPLDGGITFLIAAGAVYGGKKLIGVSKKES